MRPNILSLLLIVADEDSVEQGHSAGILGDHLLLARDCSENGIFWKRDCGDNRDSDLLRASDANFLREY